MRDKLKEKGIAHQIDFSLHLAHSLASMNATKANLVLSPLSVHTVLSLIAVGSNSATLKELLSILGSLKVEHPNDLYKNSTGSLLANGSDTGGPHLCSSNSVWVRYGLAPSSCTEPRLLVSKDKLAHGYKMRQMA